MGPLATIIGILILILIVQTPPSKPILTKPAQIGGWVTLLLFAAIVTGFGIHTPERAPEMIGQALGSVMIVGAFAVIGTVLRNRREKRRDKFGGPK
jgi:uncharacterized BrkB/YihY/UPF0761 family membrane protein